ncbi:MAG: hypothetical protein Q7R39_14270 [Dehalococcoidia bacterium]|nr:hypothetical protein [Dehalococcoidia bacterium]
MADLLRILCDRYGKGFTERVLDRQGGLQDWVRVMVDNDLLEDGNLDARLGATTGGPTRVVVYLLPAEIGG